MDLESRDIMENNTYGQKIAKLYRKNCPGVIKNSILVTIEGNYPKFTELINVDIIN